MKIYNVVEFGAIPDGKTCNTKAIQAAIDACGVGDQVLIPSGVFVSGALFLHSEMSFCVEEGAVLLGSTDLNEYPLYRYRFEGKEQLCHASLINTVDIRDTGIEDEWYQTGYIADASKRLKGITIEGKGTIDANGTVLRKLENEAKLGIRGRVVVLRNTDGVIILDIIIRQSPAWCVHPIFCTDVLLDHMKICNKYAEDGTPYDLINGDGFDPDSCKNVRVTCCEIESQDDCIAIKSGRDAEGCAVGIPTENVEIINSVFRYGFGVAVGSEMSGGVRNVLVKNCKFEDTYSLASVKAPRGRGGVIEDIIYENIQHINNSLEHQDCRWFRGAIYIDQFYSYEEYDEAACEPKNEGTAVIRNITFKNVESVTKAGRAVFLMGLPEQPLENIFFENVEASGLNGLLVGNTKGLSMKDTVIGVCQ